MDKLFFSPHFPKGMASNPYCDNYIESIDNYFSIVSAHKHTYPKGVELLMGSFKADYYIINWLESVVHFRFGALNAFLGLLALFVIHLRGKKILWMFHNIHPHGGETFWSKVIQHTLFKWSFLIVSHSQEASEYAQKLARCNVLYKPHPFINRAFKKWSGDIKECDFFIWGNIYPYKGIIEFLSNPTIKKTNAKIYILGKAVNEDIKKQIEENVQNNITFENRCAEFEEIAAQCKRSKYVLFPYVGDSISSSGVLMDTLLMGGIPVGPNRGAFADLNKEGCCITYNNIEEVVNLLSRTSQSVARENVDKLISENTWDSFGYWVSNELKKTRI